MSQISDEEDRLTVKALENARRQRSDALEMARKLSEANENLQRDIARLTAEGKELREQLNAANAMAKHFRDELAKHCLDEACCDGSSDLPRVTAELDEARRRLGLGQIFLEYFDLYFSLLRPSSQADDARQAMFTAAMDFRASLPAKPSGPSDEWYLDKVKAEEGSDISAGVPAKPSGGGDAPT